MDRPCLPRDGQPLFGPIRSCVPLVSTKLLRRTNKKSTQAHLRYPMRLFCNMRAKALTKKGAASPEAAPLARGR
jgi:hypothetical protein